MKLNSEKIIKILKENERPISWLARKLEITPDALYYRLENEVITNDIDKVADILGIELPKIIIDETKVY